MNVPFHLRKRANAEPATALLLLSHAAADLLDLCARLGLDPLPDVFKVIDGFLVALPRPVTEAIPRAIRLRSLCSNLLLPTDADLVPTLHNDEARGLVRDRGLVFLPGERTLAFHADRPVAFSSLIQVESVRRGSWRPFPRPRRLAERIESIQLDLPEPPAEEVLDAGGSDISTEAPRPDGAGILDTIANSVAAGTGRSLMGLGNLLGLKGLAQLGAGMVARAIENVPRLSESVLGRQEAALRDLLRLFREGKLEQALRRALPMGGDDGRGGIAATDAQLPIHSLRYSLGNLLGGGGRASLWFGGYDVQRALEAEYRKAADAAVERGDYRRAAFIHGKLLHNFRRAAEVLFQGGLYADAALLFLKKLDDRASAARAYELAGEIDRAVQLYRQLGDHAMAGDVLRRAGEEEQAFNEYCIAAANLADREDFLAAADLMLTRALRPKEAQVYLEFGWERRPAGNSVGCAFRLAQIHADCCDGAGLAALTAEARAFFDPPGNDAQAGKFYNTVADLAKGPGLVSVRDNVRDLALLGLAAKVRQRVAVETRPGGLVSSLFGGLGTWPAEVVSDARFAVQAAFKRDEPTRQPRPIERVRLSTGTVTAACAAGQTGDVFVGFASGEIVAFQPGTGVAVSLTAGDGWPIHRLSAAPDGQMLLSLQVRFHPPAGETASSQLTAYVRKHAGWETAMVPQKGWLALHIANSIVPDSSGYRWCAWDWENLTLGLGSIWAGQRMINGQEVSTGLLLPPLGDRPQPVLLWMDGDTVWCRAIPGERPWRGLGSGVPGEPAAKGTPWGWGPAVVKDTGLLAPPISWLQTDNLELAFLNEAGVLRWTKLSLNGDAPSVIATYTGVTQGGYRAAAIIRPGLVAAVAANRIDWLAVNSKHGKLGETPADLAWASAAFASQPTGELVIVCGDGDIACVPLPA